MALLIRGKSALIRTVLQILICNRQRSAALLFFGLFHPLSPAPGQKVFAMVEMGWFGLVILQ